MHNWKHLSRTKEEWEHFDKEMKKLLPDLTNDIQTKPCAPCRRQTYNMFCGGCLFKMTFKRMGAVDEQQIIWDRLAKIGHYDSLCKKYENPDETLYDIVTDGIMKNWVGQRYNPDETDSLYRFIMTFLRRYMQLFRMYNTETITPELIQKTVRELVMHIFKNFNDIDLNKNIFE